MENEKNKVPQSCNIDVVRCSFIKGNYYTKHYTDDIMIFKVKGKLDSEFMIKVDMCCGQDGDEFGENTEVYLGNQGASEGTCITEATDEEIRFLNSIALNYT